MEAEERLATPRQVALIEKLAERTNTDRPAGAMTMPEASKLITELLEKNNGQHQENGTSQQAPAVTNVRRPDNITQNARLGMAFRLAYQNWTSHDTPIFDKKQRFIEHVINIYKLINETAQKATETTR
jgi:hypothetical protein